MLKTLLSFLPPPYSLSRLFTLLIFLSGKQALMMVISLEIMAMFRKVEEESRGLELFFSDLACSLSSWMGTIASGIGTLFLTLRFPVSSQLVCEQAAHSRRTLCSWSVCLICWVHRWAQVMCTGALGKNTGRHCCAKEGTWASQLPGSTSHPHSAGPSLLPGVGPHELRYPKPRSELVSAGHLGRPRMVVKDHELAGERGRGQSSRDVLSSSCSP